MGWRRLVSAAEAAPSVRAQRFNAALDGAGRSYRVRLCYAARGRRPDSVDLLHASVSGRGSVSRHVQALAEARQTAVTTLFGPVLRREREQWLWIVELLARLSDRALQRSGEGGWNGHIRWIAPIQFH
jgi:hypothetical protein